MSERLACKAVGLARSTYRRLPLAATPADPDAELRAWLSAYATKHPLRHGFRRAWTALRHEERGEVNTKKVHPLWREEGLQVRMTSTCKRAGVSLVPQMAADAPEMVWAIDFQFDSTIDGKAIKIASMIDKHTRVSLLHLVERSITAERLVTKLERCSPQLANRRRCCARITVRSWFLKRCNSFALARSDRPTSLPAPRGTTATSNPSTTDCERSGNRNHWATLLEARV